MQRFRYKLHRNSPAVEKIIKGMERDGHYYFHNKPYKLVNAVRDGVYINLEVERLPL